MLLLLGVVFMSRMPTHRCRSSTVTLRFPQAWAMLGQRARASTGATVPLWAECRLSVLRSAAWRSRRSTSSAGRRRSALGLQGVLDGEDDGDWRLSRSKSTPVWVVRGAFSWRSGVVVCGRSRLTARAGAAVEVVVSGSAFLFFGVGAGAGGDDGGADRIRMAVSWTFEAAMDSARSFPKAALGLPEAACLETRANLPMVTAGSLAVAGAALNERGRAI